MAWKFHFTDANGNEKSFISQPLEELLDRIRRRDVPFRDSLKEFSRGVASGEYRITIADGNHIRFAFQALSILFHHVDSEGDSDGKETTTSQAASSRR